MLAFLLPKMPRTSIPADKLGCTYRYFFPRTFSDISRTSRGCPLYCSSKETKLYCRTQIATFANHLKQTYGLLAFDVAIARQGAQTWQTNQKFLTGKQLFRHCLCRWHSCQLEPQNRDHHKFMLQIKVEWISDENFNQPFHSSKKWHFKKKRKFNVSSNKFNVSSYAWDMSYL